MIRKNCPTCGHKLKLTPEERSLAQKALVERSKAKGTVYGRKVSYDRLSLARSFIETGSMAKTAKLFKCSRSSVRIAIETVKQKDL